MKNTLLETCILENFSIQPFNKNISTPLSEALEIINEKLAPINERVLFIALERLYGHQDFIEIDKDDNTVLVGMEIKNNFENQVSMTKEELEEYWKQKQLEKQTELEKVNHPSHYNQHPSGVECITIVEHFNFNLGNAIKYIWRAGLKGEEPVVDLKKALWYIQREIERLEKQ